MALGSMFVRLAALPTVRRVPAVAPIQESLLVAGVEVARAVASTETALRRTWRDRHRGGPTPLLVLAPTADDGADVLGPVDGGGVIRSLDLAPLEALLVRVAPLPRLEAVRELAAEVERLDRSGVPGLVVRELLTLHTVDVRLRGDAVRWGELSDAVKRVPPAPDWRSLLSALGYVIEQLPRRGHLARFDGAPVAVIHGKPSAADFGRLDRDGRPPEGVLLNDCGAHGARYGLLAAGGRVRLFDAEAAVGSPAARYLDLDAGSLRSDDRPLLGLLGPSYLAQSGFEGLEEEARTYGAGLRRRLDATIRDRALPVLARALGRWARAQGMDPSVDAVREDLERAALTLAFRALFLLYAESAGSLPMASRAYRQASLTALVEEAAGALDPASTSLWDRFAILVKAMRSGQRAWGVPAYNGDLFAPDGFDGASLLERLELRDDDFGAVLVGLGRDVEADRGVDYSTLDIGHLGHIYEGLLSLRLVAAETSVAYDARADRYLPAEEGESLVEAGDLLWQTHEGGRKGGGVYYTRAELVRHLVRQAVTPTFAEHLEEVRRRAATDPAGAADQLFDFAVLDPACGSAHFLVVVVDELADALVRFLADTPLPSLADALERLRSGATPGAVIDDVALLRRLVLKRCVFGVDVSPMGAEVAKLSLWLASFVPGLTLAYLNRNVVVGNSLVGVARRETLADAAAKGQASLLEDALDEALSAAAEAAARVAAGEDRTRDEVEASKVADAEATAATRRLAGVLNLWTAEPFGIDGARAEVDLHGAALLNGASSDLQAAADAVAAEQRFLHWPLAFPLAFDRPQPGFDVVVGNPPWDEVTVERLGFYALFRPGLRSLPEREREAAIAALLAQRPELQARLEREQKRTRLQRAYLAAAYPSGAGDPDLYKTFCRRYAELLREGGALGVVLPRSAFATDGSKGFRRWLFEESATERVDFLLNRGRWAFDAEPRYTVALVSSRRRRPGDGHAVRIAGTATSLEQWRRQADGDGIALLPEAFGAEWTTPLVRDQAEADLLAKLRRGSRFPFGPAGMWRCFPVRELDEANDKALWASGRGSRLLWKGGSFDRYHPHGAGSRPIESSPAVQRKVLKPRPGAGSLVATDRSGDERRRMVADEIVRSRVAFRDVTRATDGRTVRACLVPPETYLSNTAPYLAFQDGSYRTRLVALAILNSLPFDWQARRFVEIHLNFFVLEGLVVPDLEPATAGALAAAAARLSCVDGRYAEVAEGLGVTVGPVTAEERRDLEVEIDALVAHAWGLDDHDLEVLLRDFTADAVPAEHRRALRDRLASPA